MNVDHNQQLAADYRITGIPTLLLFKQGRVEETIVGVKSKRDLKANLDKVLTPGEGAATAGWVLPRQEEVD